MTASPARCMSATTGSFCKASTTSRPCCRRRRSSTTGRWASRSSSTWCGRPLIIGTAWLIRRARARAAKAAGHLLATPVSGGPCAGRGRLVRAVAGDHLRGACCGVLFAAHPGLAVGRRRPGGPHGRPVAPTPATSCRDRGMGRAGADPAGLHPVERGPRSIRVPPRCCPCWARCW